MHGRVVHRILHCLNALITIIQTAMLFMIKSVSLAILMSKVYLKVTLHCQYYFVGTSCTNGDVKLVNGTTAFNGRVEYCFEGEWAALCSLSTYTASLVCKKLGFTSTCKQCY